MAVLGAGRRTAIRAGSVLLPRWSEGQIPGSCSVGDWRFGSRCFGAYARKHWRWVIALSRHGAAFPARRQRRQADHDRWRRNAAAVRVAWERSGTAETRQFHPLPASPAQSAERGGAVEADRDCGAGRCTAPGSGSGQPALGQGGPAATAANGSTGGSPMKKPSISRISSRFRCNQSRVLPSLLSCS